MPNFWVSGSSPMGGEPVGNFNRQIDVTLQIRDLEHEVQRLMLKNQALWELVRDRLKLTDSDLDRKSEEIDLRDGVKDDQVTITPLKCPTCGRVSSSKHWKCLYCGQEFEKPAMG